ncbi:MAG: FkbM family methyltransferase [Prosthecobacter sp.]
MNKAYAVRHIQKTFTSGTIPSNVKLKNFLKSKRFLGRFAQKALGSNFCSHTGSFNYLTGGEPKKILFNGRNLQFNAIYGSRYRYGYELETALLIAILCNDKSSFWDIGANWGYFSLLAASLPDFTGTVEAFEPNPRTFPDLCSTVKQAGLERRVRCHNLGAGDATCEMELEETDKFNTGLSRLVSGGKGTKIQVIALDEFVSSPPRLIKIDAEEMELVILRGAPRLLKEDRPFLIFENFSHFKNPSLTCEPINFLNLRGYEVYVPFLRFSIEGCTVTATYGSDYNSLFEGDPSPLLGLIKLNPENRFLFANQLNLLAVHESKLPELASLDLLPSSDDV